MVIAGDPQGPTVTSGAPASGMDGYLLVLQREGTCRLVAGGSERVLGPGSMALIDNRRPIDWQPGNRSRQVCIAFTSARVQARIPGLPADALVPVDGRAGIVAILRGVVAALAVVAEKLTRREQNAVHDALLALIAAILDAGTGSSVTPAARRPPRLSARQAWGAMQCAIERSLADPDLSPTGLATELGISTRQVHRVFRQADSSFCDHIRAARLARCRDDLSDPDLDGLSVTEIAYRWGFSDSSHFSRSFKAAFGMTAREFRSRREPAAAQVDARRPA